MKRLACLALSVAMLAACGPQTQGASNANAPPEETAQADANADGGAAQRRLPLPDCAGVEPTDAGNAGWKMVDCRLQSSDSSGLAFEARYDQPAGGGEGRVSVQVVAPGDATLQTIEEAIQNTFNHPSLQDIDGDETQFTRLEELSGIDIDRTDEGFITTSARSSANSWEIGYWRMDGDDLEPVVTVSVSAEDVDGDGNPVNETCTVTDAGGLAETGLTPEQAQVKFCAEDVAADTYQ